MVQPPSRVPRPDGTDDDHLAIRSCLHLHADVQGVRAGRRFVREQVVARGAHLVADDATLVAAELLANAWQHGHPPLQVCVSGTADSVRIEVTDGNPRQPVRPAESTSNMTGRGLALVDALVTRWGVERHPEGGKVVWADLGDAGQRRGDAPQISAAQRSAAAIVAGWDDDLPNADDRFTVILGDVPTDLLIEAKAHIDNVVRELTLAAAGGSTGGIDIPDHLARLIETVVSGFADARDAIKRQALAAAGRGEPRTRLTLHLPLSAADAGEAYLAALDEADGYSRAARMLTLETPPDHRLFRQWYVEAVVRQLREVAAGRQPEPPVSFEDRLVAEVRRLSAAQRVSDRAARLQRVTAALARARTPEDVADVVVSEGVNALDASGGGLLVPAGDGEHLALPGVVGYADELIDALREERLDAELPAATALRTGVPIWLESRDERDQQFPALRGFEASTVAMCAVPLVVGDRSLGALRFSFTTRKLFDEDERQFVLALAAQTAATLQRTELYEAERKAALDLQRALLPQDPVAIPGWEVATYYSPAGDQEAGGDFYDVLRFGDDRVMALVGDVMGRGLSAAATMAQVRSTIRAYAIDDPEPTRVFTRVDRFFEALDADQIVTVLYMLAGSGDDVVHVASAGHLPPLIVDDNGCRVASTESGTPFGVTDPTRRAMTLRLPPGAALVAITDGLVERRGEDIDEGVQRLLDACKDTIGWGAERLLRHVVQAAAADRLHDDDVTVLVLRRLPG